MKIKKLMFGAAVAATIALVFPAQALGITTTTAITTSGTQNAKTTMQAGDFIDAKVSAPNNFDTTAQVSREVTRSSLGFKWSGESLQLKTATDITSPEGWDLEYTTDGSAWSSTKPSAFTTITGVRSTGTYTKTSSGVLRSSTTATLLANATDFSGGSGGDGFNLTFVGDRVYNVYHHADLIYLDCHLKATGSTCYGAPKQFAGFETPNSAHAWVNALGNRLFVPVRQVSDSAMGLACIDLTSRINPVACSTAFVALSTTNNRQNMSGAAQVGEKLYIPNPYDWKMHCFDMDTAARCTGSVWTTGWSMPHTTNVTSTDGDAFTIYGRASNISDKVFWSSDTEIGCFDPASGANGGAPCASSTNVAIGTSLRIGDAARNGTNSNEISVMIGSTATWVSYQFPMFPVRDSNNAILGACYFATQQCLNTSGAVVDILPNALKTWMKAHPLPRWITSDSGQFGEYDKKIYFPVGPSLSATADVYCFDYATSAACSAFGTAGTKASVNTELYSLQADPDSRQPNCIWTNSNSGRIKTFNATTGTPGCASASSTVRFTNDKLTPRLACSETSRVSGWGTVNFYSPGISASVLRVTVNDVHGNPISGFNDVQLSVDPNSDVRGSLNLSTLTSTTRPTILVTAVITVAGTLLSDITATVDYASTDPQMCIILRAKVNCATAYTPPVSTDVGDGIITTIATRSATSYGLNNVQLAYASEAETNPQTLIGSGTVVCPAAVSGGGGGGAVTTLPVVTPPKTKRPPVTITIGGFKDGSPILTKAIQSKIKAFLKKYNDYPVIETAGFTEGPVVLKTDFALSKARAVNATAFIKKDLKKTFSVVKIKSGQDKVEASKVRRIKITLTDE